MLCIVTVPLIVDSPGILWITPMNWLYMFICVLVAFRLVFPMLLHSVVGVIWACVSVLYGKLAV